MKFAVRTITVLLFISAFMTTGCADADSVNRSGSSAPSNNFTLKDVTGASVSLDGLLQKNKAVLVNFWATWCPPCREEIPDLIALQAKDKDRGLTILGVDVGESPTKVGNFVEKFGINYPVVLDSEMKVSESYRVVGIPTTYLMNSQGKIIGQYHGFTRDLESDVEKALQS